MSKKLDVNTRMLIKQNCKQSKFIKQIVGGNGRVIIIIAVVTLTFTKKLYRHSHVKKLDKTVIRIQHLINISQSLTQLNQFN